MIRLWCKVALMFGLLHASSAVAQGPKPSKGQDAEIQSLRNQLQTNEKELLRTTVLLEEAKRAITALQSFRETDKATIHDNEKKLATASELLKEAKNAIDKLESYREMDKGSIQANEKGIINVEASQTRLWWAGSFIAALMTLGGGAAILYYYNQAKKWLQHRFLREVKTQFAKDINGRFGKEKESFVKSFNERLELFNRQISDLVGLIQRAERRQHDEAIEAIDWDGTLVSLQKYPVEIQKLIIQSALQATKRNELGPVAWEAAEQIFMQTKTESCLSFLYELAAAAHDWNRGYAYYKRHGGDVQCKSNPHGFLALLEILRRNLDFAEALRVERIYVGRKVKLRRTRLSRSNRSILKRAAIGKLLGPWMVFSLKRAGRNRIPATG